MQTRSILTLFTTLIVAISAITTGPGPVIISPPITIESTLSPTSVTTYPSTASCAPPNQQYLSYCCSGTLLQPFSTTATAVGTATPSTVTGIVFTTQASALSSRDAANLEKRQTSASDEPNGVGRTRSLQIFPETVLGDGVTCFGSVATLAGNAGSMTAGSSASTSSAVSSSTVIGGGSGSTTSSAISSGSTASETGTTGTESSMTSAAAGSSSTTAASASSTVSAGGATREQVGNSFFGGLLGVIIALL